MRRLLLMLAAFAPTAPAAAAQRSFTVTDFSRVRVDGPFRVVLTTNVAPFARATGSTTALDRVDIAVEDQTLIVRPSASSWSSYPGQDRGPITVVLGTHDLAKAWLNGSGALNIDKVRGQSFDLAVEGAGSASIGRLDVDTLKLGMSGSGSAAISGSATATSAIIRGASSFDGSGLRTKNATIGAEGSAVIKLITTDTARIDARGLVAIDLAGHPTCEVHADGTVEVSGCR